MDESADNEKRKVLVIDDESTIIVYLVTVLEDHGFATCSAADAETGILNAKKERPDLICLDIMMPKRSGISLYQELKQDPATSDIPVIFISAFNQVRDLREPTVFRKMIPDQTIPMPEDCIEKPIVVDDFIQSIEKNIHSPR